MRDRIHIQLLDSFTLHINGVPQNQLMSRSRKGIMLMAYLILNNGQPVSNQRLFNDLWPEENSGNPLNSLKTMVCRTRALLNQLSDGLGDCISAERGAYRWKMLPGVTVDLYEIEDIYGRLAAAKDDDAETCRLTKRLIELYKGDLMQDSDTYGWMAARAESLREGYLSAVYGYLNILTAEERYEDIIDACRSALAVQNSDDRLNMELIAALVKTNHGSEAMQQYKNVVHRHSQYYSQHCCAQASDEMLEYHRQIVHTGKMLEINLDSIRNELKEAGEQRGAFICDHNVFREIYNLQIRNLERLGISMFLAIIMVSDADGNALDPFRQEGIMGGLLELLRNNLRKGDTVTHFSPTILALLLPAVNYNSGNQVMERIRTLFYQKYPSTDIVFNYRIRSLGDDLDVAD